ncbi:MAG: hypothetical protein WCL11_25915, partial [Verrucomicrobiota bacterium]
TRRGAGGAGGGLVGGDFGAELGTAGSCTTAGGGGDVFRGGCGLWGGAGHQYQAAAISPASSSIQDKTCHGPFRACGV